MQDLIAENEEDYIKKAIEIKSKAILLDKIKLTIKEKLSRSHIFDSKKFSIDFSNLLKSLL